MKKHGYKFRRDYSVRVIPSKGKKIKFGRVSTRKLEGGKKTEGGYLNPVQIKEQLDKETITIIGTNPHTLNGIEYPRAITINKGITYMSCGIIKEES